MTDKPDGERIAVLEANSDTNSKNITILHERYHEITTLTTQNAAIIKQLSLPSNQDLQLLLVELKGDMKVILEKQETNKLWQNNHQLEDKAEFANLNTKVDKLGNLSLKLGTLGVIAGACFVKLYNYITGS